MVIIDTEEESEVLLKMTVDGGVQILGQFHTFSVMMLLIVALKGLTKITKTQIFETKSTPQFRNIQIFSFWEYNTVYVFSKFNV